MIKFNDVCETVVRKEEIKALKKTAYTLASNTTDYRIEVFTDGLQESQIEPRMNITISYGNNKEKWNADYKEAIRNICRGTE